MYVKGEIRPGLDVREIAAALAGYHYLPARTRHLLEDSHLCVKSAFHGGPGGMICGHQARGPSADYENVRFHEIKKGKA